MVRFRYRPLLFIVALILPSVVIAILGLSQVNQDQLTGTLQIRTRFAISRALRALLEHIKVGELAASTKRPWKYSDTAVFLVATVSHNLLVLPQDADSDSEAFKLAEELRLAFPTLGLNENKWKPYGDGRLWLSLTPPAGDSGQQLVIAVQSKDVIDRVRRERDDNAKNTASVFEIKSIPNETIPADCAIDGPLEKCPYMLDQDLFPNLQININADPGFQDVLKSYRNASLGLVIILSLISGFVLWRDTNRNVRISEMRSQFVSNVSHELKTPVTNIRMFAETLQMHGSTHPQIHEGYLATIVHESERLTRLVSNILDFSNIESGQKNYQRALAPLEDVVRSAADTMRFMLSEQAFSLHVEICDGLPPMWIDRDAVKQAILNLLGNAMKYSGSSRAIVLRLLHENKNALIQVQDFGTGIAPKELNRIFEKFYRIATPANRAIPGAGLGLAIIAHIVEAHGGSIYVESIPGSGSTFSIRIPVNRNGQR